MIESNISNSRSIPKQNRYPDDINHEREKCRRLMIVDDEPLILNATLRTLRNVPYTIDSFQSPLEAFHSAQKTAYDVVISDQNMPEMNGVELLSKIKNIQPECTGVILSSMGDSDTLLNAINHAHIYRYMLKPWADNDLLLMVEDAMSYHDQQVEQSRLADKARVLNGSMTRHRACIRELESKYPGITHVDRDESGAIILPSRNH